MTGTESCQICGGRVEAHRHSWLRRCRGCGVLSADFEVTIPAEASEGAIDEVARELGLEALRRANNEKILEALKRLAPAGGRLLDVGSGPGFLLAQAAAVGFRAEGIEPDANVVAAARAHGVPVRHGCFPDQMDAAEAFDVIVFNDVLEHIKDLRGVLAAVARHLRPGGVLCLNCPDKRGLFYRTAAVLDRLGVQGPYDRLWQRGLPSPHVWYFTPALLTRAAASAGLQHLEDVRLATMELKGLWERIRYVKDGSLAMSLGAFAFAAAVHPIRAVVPGDATACFFRRADGAG